MFHICVKQCTKIPLVFPAVHRVPDALYKTAQHSRHELAVLSSLYMQGRAARLLRDLNTDMTFIDNSERLFSYVVYPFFTAIL